jgi:peptide methionine sulfoxide reductase MsrA
VSDGVEKAILAGGCFWGMEDPSGSDPATRIIGLEGGSL